MMSIRIGTRKLSKSSLLEYTSPANPSYVPYRRRGAGGETLCINDHTTLFKNFTVGVMHLAAFTNQEISELSLLRSVSDFETRRCLLFLAPSSRDLAYYRPITTIRYFIVPTRVLISQVNLIRVSYEFLRLRNSIRIRNFRIRNNCVFVGGPQMVKTVNVIPTHFYLNKRHS